MRSSLLSHYMSIISILSVESKEVAWALYLTCPMAAMLKHYVGWLVFVVAFLAKVIFSWYHLAHSSINQLGTQKYSS